MYNYTDFKMSTINNNYLKLQFTENQVDYILAEFDYFNKQVHTLQQFIINNLRICFDEYVEDGNIHYNIYLIVQDENDINNFVNFIDKLI